MASLIRVTPEQLTAVAGQLRTGAGSIESTLTQLAGQVGPLGSDWAGLGQARFIALWEQWQTSSRQLHQALTDLGQLMGQAGAAYESNDQAVGASFGM
ncbi:MAG TPA: WXG100 family type VII secretion target [Acidimicrobiales bacterium]|nr:WXG100 family type VII secretion target [Acidimicrobiales bacterium]